MTDLPQPGLSGLYYSNLLLLLGILLPILLTLAMVLVWMRLLGIRFGPDVPAEAEARWQLVADLSSLGFMLPGERAPRSLWPEAGIEPKGRRVLRIGLAAVWLVGAALWCQPAIGMGGFLAQASHAGVIWAPEWFHAPALLSIRTWNPASLALTAVALQIIAATLLLARLPIGPYLSAPLGFAMWTLELGSHGVLGASMLTGAPGFGLIVSLASLLLLLRDRQWRSGRLGRRVTQAVGLIWILGAGLQSSARFWQPGNGGLFTPLGQIGRAGPASFPILWIAHLSVVQPVEVNAVLVVSMAAFGVWLAFTGSFSGRPAIIGALWLGFIWLIAGPPAALPTGRVMDVGTAAIWALLFAACASRDRLLLREKPRN